MNEGKNKKDPIINCHTHIFTSGHVPPFLAKTFIISPLHRILHLHGLLKIYKKFRKNSQKKYWGKTKVKARKKYQRRMLVRRNVLLQSLINLVGFWFTLQAMLFILDWLRDLLNIKSNFVFEPISDFADWLGENNLICPTENTWTKVLIVLIVLLFFKSGRNLIYFIGKKALATIVKLPGKETKALLNRYLLIGKHALHEEQGSTFSDMAAQYPEGTKFVVLPMDMTEMGAGSPPVSYMNQMDELVHFKSNSSLKDAMLPFVFADPRRIAKHKDYFSFHTDANGSVLLNQCSVKEYLEDYSFCGIKIYPALGYFPFDKDLLPLWKYAVDHDIPIMTHCIRGTIFYRGKKKPEWDFHPVFMQSEGKDNYQALCLDYKNNLEFQVGFTHPLNYLCLLHEPYLRRLVDTYKDAEINKIFGFTDLKTPLERDLSKLKICFAHFGGDDEWKKYLENDRYEMSLQLSRYPDKGISFFQHDQDLAWGKMESLWRYGDWYSILCSMMIRYENVYSDVSYILENEEIFPLLKQTLSPNHGKLRNKVLFGTDFYVVRNHNSEKDLLYRSKHALSKEEFDLIARENPKKYLNLN